MTQAAYAIVNLSAVKHNLEKIRAYAPNSKVLAVIKANAYGHGLLRIAEALMDVDAMAVARAAEAIRLRKAAYSNRIVILEGFVCEQELIELMQYDLDVVVHSIDQVEVLEKYTGPKKVTVWLKLDTGMNRLGFKVADLNTVYQRLLNASHVNPAILLMTHFSSADEVSNHTTQQQINIFHDAVKTFFGETSLANSAAIIAWPDSLTDWVRPGIMLYGVSPFADRKGTQLGLEPVMSLHSRLISVKMIEPGDAVGYAGTWVCKTQTKLGVVAIGYGDGYPRAAKVGTPVLINGRRVPLVGRVSMDMITVDLSTQPDTKVGDSVTLWGDGLAVEEIAEYSDTIPYTLLCGITQRVEIKKVNSD